ncbi:hypothetical protein KR009_009273, partial [Drosophila setifemur]
PSETVMNKWYWICWICILKFAGAEEPKFRITLDEVVISDVDWDIFDQFDCTVYQINNRSYYDSNQIFKRDVDNFAVHAVLDFWKSNNQKMKMFDGHVDGCQFLDNVYKNRLFNIYAKNLRKHSKITFKCPFQAKVNYALRKMHFDERDFPTFVPYGKFRTNIEYLIDGNRTARIVVNGQITQ